jgi:hypothetical protein
VRIGPPLLLAGLLAGPAAALETFPHEQELFGVSLRVEARKPEVRDRLVQQIERLTPDLLHSLDPDCIWRPEPCTNRNAERTRELEVIAAGLHGETLGFFDIHAGGRTGKRDFAGMSQGYLLERMARHTDGEWIGDFAGDIYISGGFQPTRTVGISDPLLETVPYAQVEMKRGWMIAATGPALGGKVRKLADEKTAFRRVVLFAAPGFSGTRLDAWSTALTAGGSTLLKHLWNLEPYRGQWGYLIFDAEGRVLCSPNIRCQLDQRPRTVTVDFNTQ